jgi:hypothetical protein
MTQMINADSHPIPPDLLNPAVTAPPSCRCEGSVTDRTSSLKNKISTATSFRELCSYTQRAHPHISFFGRRYISVEGCTGTVDINELPQRVLELIKQDPHFNEEERSHGKTIASRIDRLYHHSEELLADTNLCTRCMGNLAKRVRILCDDSSPEYLWRRLNTYRSLDDGKKTETADHYSYAKTQSDSYNEIFNLYTKTQHQKAFSIEPTSRCSWAIRNGTRHFLPFAERIDFEQRWRVPQKWITSPSPKLETEKRKTLWFMLTHLL